MTIRLVLACAVAMAAAFLSKTSALFFPIPFALVILTEKAKWRQKAKLLTALFICAGLAAPWLIMNQILYGDPLAKKAMYSAVGSLINEKRITSPYFVHVFPEKLATSFVGVFGWGTLPSPRWVYYMFWLLLPLSYAVGPNPTKWFYPATGQSLLSKRTSQRTNITTLHSR